jgi:hypothetical protein
MFFTRRGRREGQAREILAGRPRVWQNTMVWGYVGGEGYVEQLEKLLWRVLHRRKPGRKPTRARQ